MRKFSVRKRLGRSHSFTVKMSSGRRLFYIITSFSLISPKLSLWFLHPTFRLNIIAYNIQSIPDSLCCKIKASIEA